MNFGATYRKLDAVQQTRLFKIIATIVVIVIAAGLVISYGLKQKARSDETNRLYYSAPDPSTDPNAPKETDAEKAAREEFLRGATAHAALYNRLVEQQFDVTTVAFGTSVITALVVAAIWMGLGLTYLCFACVALVLIWPMMAWGNETWRSVAYFIAGVLVLSVSFTTLVRLLALAFSYSHPITAIARTVVAEAVRMKVSLVFIVLLILGLAALPGLLDPNTPLRYRVQSFLQYGAAGSFWITATLSVFLGAASVAFEQRDRIIWQTMTKPVKSWHYIAGKWLGVVGIAAVLLGVSCTGVFIFTEYLRRTQTAVDELRPYVSAKGEGTISEDRLMLESQVLVGRKSVRPVIPVAMSAEVEQAIETKRKEQIRLATQSPREYDMPDDRKLRKEVESEMLADFLGIAPGGVKSFEFQGLAEAQKFDLPMMLRYKVHAGSDSPTEFYTVTFMLVGSDPLPRSTPLGQVLTMPISAAAIRTMTDPENKYSYQALVLYIANGDMLKRTINEKSISFAPDGLEMSYVVSSFQANFLRVVLVMWLKIAFLAMIAIVTATFLAFPVACMVAFGSFFLAEGTKGLATSLDYFNPTTDDKSWQWAYDILTAIARPLTWIFRFYADLNPTEDLVEGRLVSWGSVSGGVMSLGLLIVLFGAIGAWIFKSRELATYSGQ